jgi:hypothetical protein
VTRTRKLKAIRGTKTNMLRIQRTMKSSTKKKSWKRIVIKKEKKLSQIRIVPIKS